MSVACELRDDWQPPQAHPIQRPDADAAFAFVYARVQPRVMAFVRAKFGQRAGDPEALTTEAWARLFCEFWSTDARKRFLGLCHLTTLVCQIARHVALDELRNHRERGSQDDTRPSLDQNLLLELIDCPNDPAQPLGLQELHDTIRACIDELPARQRLVATMVWLRDIPAKRAAELLHISEPAVSQHLAKARRQLQQTLQTKGFSIPTRRETSQPEGLIDDRA